MLKLENITAGYGVKQVLHDLSLEVSAGEITALIGPNGAGKSTVLKVVAGLLKPSTGSVALDGRDITSSPTYRRSRLGIGCVMQNAPVFGGLTVAEHFRLTNLTPTACNGLSKPAGVLSGGERHRLAVELVLHRKLKLLLLDEPSAGVSPDIAKEIYAEIKRNIAGTETAVLVVEQNIHYLPDFANRVIVMRNGRIYNVNSAISEIMTRNSSHNTGKYLLAKINSSDLPIEHLKNTEIMFEVFYGS
ncbi:MAG: ATP-binding cassette domain-containing protein [Planctomycetaceae bacterium]|nr:ATP-binding cassette domain-containing protein [Planctomycetaceae bacterium]